METKLQQADGPAVALAAELLKGGGIVAIPTETVYGIAASALDGAAVKKNIRGQGPPQDNPLIVHIDRLEMLEGLVGSVPERAKKLAEAFWPGPLTMILPRGPRVAAEVCAGLDTVAVRMPSHPVARAVITACGLPPAPSANLSGSPSPTTAHYVMEDMRGRLPLILDGVSARWGVESTVVSLAGPQAMLLRPAISHRSSCRRLWGKRCCYPARFWKN